MEYNVALAGNPNVGKTSLYNRITNSFEHVGNYPGITVEKIAKKIDYDGKIINVTDLPGLYSLTVYSPEEAVSRDIILAKSNDIVINVCEGNNLSRNLYLTLQLLELNIPSVLAVNMIDELKKRGISVDGKKLESRLKIPVALTSAKHKHQTAPLLEKLSKKLDNNTFGDLRPQYLDKLPLAQVVSLIKLNIIAAKLDETYAAIKVLENDEFVLQKLNLSQTQKNKLKEFGDTQSIIASIRYKYIDEILKDIFVNSKVAGKINDISRIDKLTLNKYLAFPIFLIILATIFFITFGSLGSYLSGLLDKGISKFIYAPLSSFLTNAGVAKWICGLLCDGIILGVGGILAFLPQVILLFLFLAILEDSGYISRVAFMTDGFFRKFGLSGKSAFTLLMGFGCSATAVLTTKTLEDENVRKKTILLTPFMSCSARLPVYSVIAAAFFTANKPLVVFSMYILGIAVSLIIAIIFEKLIKPLKSGNKSFIMEMPQYRLPTLERIFFLIKNNIKVFLVKVGTVVFALNVIVYVLSNFSVAHGFIYGTQYLSIFQTLGTVLAPVFAPLGFGSWKAVTALLGGIAAKEIVISIISSLGGAHEVFTGQYAAISALSFMVFTLLYIPCLATLAAIKKETSTRFMLVCLLVQLLSAYIMSLAVYWTGRLFVCNFALTLSLLILLPVALITFLSLRSLIKNKNKCGHCSKCGGCAKADTIA